MTAANIGIAGESMQNQNGIGSIGIEFTRRFIADIDMPQFPPAFQFQSILCRFPEGEIARYGNQLSFRVFHRVII